MIGVNLHTHPAVAANLLVDVGAPAAAAAAPVGPGICPAPGSCSTIHLRLVVSVATAVAPEVPPAVAYDGLQLTWQPAHLAPLACGLHACGTPRWPGGYQPASTCIFIHMFISCNSEINEIFWISSVAHALHLCASLVRCLNTLQDHGIC